MSETHILRSRVVQPDEAPSHWQPVPANGYVELHVDSAGAGGGTPFESGTQTVAPGARVRPHQHDEHEELILVYAGEGTAVVDGERHPMRPGTTVYLAARSRHEFINEGAEPLRFFWVLMPGGLGTFFAAIGRERAPGEPAPAPFPRPDNVAQIEAETVFSRVRPAGTVERR